MMSFGDASRSGEKATAIRSMTRRDSPARAPAKRAACDVRRVPLHPGRGEAHAPALPEGRLSVLRSRRRAGHAPAVRARYSLGQRGHAEDARPAPHSADRSVGSTAARAPARDEEESPRLTPGGVAGSHGMPNEPRAPR